MYEEGGGTIPRATLHPSPGGGGSPRLKSYTQGAAAGGKHRPPVMFYTVRDNRAPSEPPGSIPIGPPHHYRGAPTVGRPVVFLNMFGQRESQGGCNNFLFTGLGDHGWSQFGSDWP